MKHSLPPIVAPSPETWDRLALFVALLIQWSERINLVGRGDMASLWARHVDDSLQLIPLLDGRAPPAIDLGSGGGFPGLVLAIATGHEFHLVEADQRKATFLREAARETGAPAIVHAKRAEVVDLAPASTVTARALAPLAQLLPLAERLLAPKGTCLFLKGKTVDEELTHAKARWHMQVTKWQSRTDPDACILQLSEIAIVDFRRRPPHPERVRSLGDGCGQSKGRSGKNHHSG